MFGKTKNGGGKVKNKGLECLGWLIIVIVAFWGGWLTSPEKVRIEKVPGPESIVYKIDEIPLNAISAYLGVQGLGILPKERADKIKAEEQLIWQSGYKAGYNDQKPVFRNQPVKR